MSDGIHFLQFPTWEQMNFASNCTVWGNWLGIILTPDPWNPDVTIGPAFTTSVDVFTAALPANATVPENTTLPEYYGYIADWFLYNINYDQPGHFSYGTWNLTPEFYTNVLVHPAGNCTDEFCQAMSAQGNADLTGIGVFISYIVEATLATMYLLAFTAWRIYGHFQFKEGRAPSRNLSLVHVNAKRNGIRAKLATSTLAQRTFDSFRGSHGGFLSAAMLMSLAMLCASLYLNIQGIKNQTSINSSEFPYHSSALYDMILSFRASLFSVFPVMLLYALKGRRNGYTKTKGNMGSRASQDDVHHMWMRRCVIVVIWILFTVETYLSPRGNPDYKDLKQGFQITPCDKRGADYLQGTKAAELAVIIAPIVWIAITAFVITGFGIPGVVNNRWISKWRSVWRLGTAWINCGFMWAILYYFLILRQNILELAGSSDQQNTWGFGQVLALATWVPIGAEFCYIFIWGIKESLDSRVPSGFEVRHVGSGMLLNKETTVGDEKQVASPDGVAEPSAQTAEPYQGEEQVMATSMHAINTEGQPAPHIDPENGGHQHPQAPWQEWNSTGW